MISCRPLGFVALISWLIAVSIGIYSLPPGVVGGALLHQRNTGGGVPPAVVFGHAGAALTGLAVWLSYLASGWRPLAWAGVGLIGIAITLGICTVTLWTPYPVRAAEAEGSVAVVTESAAGPGEPAETFRVTD